MQRLLDKRIVVFAHGGRVFEFPAPDENIEVTGHSYGSVQQLTTGLYAPQFSAYGGRKLALQWSRLNRQQASLFANLFQGVRQGPYQFLSPFTIKANFLPPLGAYPALHVLSKTPVAGGLNQPLTTVQVGDSQAVVCSQYHSGTSYEVPLILPANKTISARVEASGYPSNTPFYLDNQRLPNGLSTRYYSGAGQPWVLKKFKFNPGGAVGTYLKVQVGIYGEDTDPEPAGWGNLMLVPEATTLTLINAAQGRYMASVEFVEVY